MPVRTAKTKKITQLVISSSEGIIQFSQYKRQKATKINGRCPQEGIKKVKVIVQLVAPPPLYKHHSA